MARTLRQIRADIEAGQAQGRKISALNTGVIRGATDITDIQDQILRDIAEYNRRSRRDHYYLGRLEAGSAV